VKALYLLRHAKSSWADGSLPDHDRPLAPRGEKATNTLARYIAEERIAPALVLCSTAARARQTLDGVAAALGDDVEVWHEGALYGASAHELVKRLRRLQPTVPSVMIVGHNPGLEDLALELIGDGDASALARLHAKFPTGALATLVVPGTWKALAPGRATLTAFVVPRDLPAGHAG
jgi:phosphohistidine phosphatase